MADFCKACSTDMFGKDYHEMAGLCPTINDVAIVLCEGCGPIFVNSNGECVSTECSCKGQEGHGVRHVRFTDAAGNALPTPSVAEHFPGIVGPGVEPPTFIRLELPVPLPDDL